MSLVFDDKSEAEFEEDNIILPHQTVKAYYRRKNHLKDLLEIYTTQTSGRLGLSSLAGLTTMLPQLQRDLRPSGKSPLEKFAERMNEIKRHSQFMALGTDQRGPMETVQTQTRHAIQDLVLDFWEEIAKIMESGNIELFKNRRHTRQIISSGRYEEKLQEFQQPLKAWKENFDSTTDCEYQPIPIYFWVAF
jgi:hypothetical protein